MFAFRCKAFNLFTITLTMSRGGEMFTSWILPQAFSCIFGPSSVIWPKWHCSRRCRSTTAWSPSFLAVPAFPLALELAHSWSCTNHHTHPSLQTKPQKIKKVSAGLLPRLAFHSSGPVLPPAAKMWWWEQRAWTRGNDSAAWAPTQFSSYLSNTVKIQLLPSTAGIAHISKQENLLIALLHAWTYERARQKPETWLGITVRETGGVSLKCYQNPCCCQCWELVCNVMLLFFIVQDNISA